MSPEPTIRRPHYMAKPASTEYGEELSPSLVHEKILAGEAHYLGTVRHKGEVHDYYRVDVNGKTTYIYSVR